jgi:hypothetical protein
MKNLVPGIAALTLGMTAISCRGAVSREIGVASHDTSTAAASGSSAPRLAGLGHLVTSGKEIYANGCHLVLDGKKHRITGLSGSYLGIEQLELDSSTAIDVLEQQRGAERVIAARGDAAHAFDWNYRYDLKTSDPEAPQMTRVKQAFIYCVPYVRPNPAKAGS